MFLESIKWWHSKHSRPTDLFLEGVKGFHFQMIFLIKIDRESPTFSSVEGLKLGFYRPLSTFLMEIFSSFCDYVFLFWWFSFAFTSLTFAPHKFSLCHRKCVLHLFFWGDMTARNWKDYVLNQWRIHVFPVLENTFLIDSRE